MLFQNTHVSVLLIHLPRYDHAGFHPSHGTSAILRAVRRETDYGYIVRVTTVISLIIPDRVEPTGVKRIDIHIISSRTSEYLRIPCPAHTLIPLRTIGRNRQEITPLAPNDVIKQTVDTLVRRLITARPRTDRFQHDPFHRLQG